MHTASIVAAVFTLGLGLGGCGLGVWADRRYRRAPDSLLLAFGVVELLIAGLGVAIVFLFPSVQALAARSASYVRDGDGWCVLSAKTYVNQAAIACAVVGPSAILLGGTLTLVLRHVVRGEVESDGGWKIGLVYAVNIAGAATGAFLTDIAIVPALGVRTAQLIACALNAAAGAGAIVLSRTGAVSAF